MTNQTADHVSSKTAFIGGHDEFVDPCCYSYLWRVEFGLLDDVDREEPAGLKVRLLGRVIGGTRRSRGAEVPSEPGREGGPAECWKPLLRWGLVSLRCAFFTTFSLNLVRCGTGGSKCCQISGCSRGSRERQSGS